MDKLEKLNIGGTWKLECFRNGNKLWEEGFHNTWTAEGLNHLLNVYFHDTTPVATWYCLIFESDTTPGDGTTYATPVFTECTAYTETARPVYNESAASGKKVTNVDNKAVFTMNASKTIYGAALVSVSTKGDTIGGGILPVADRFRSSRAVVSGDVLNLTYEVSCQDAGV